MRCLLLVLLFLFCFEVVAQHEVKNLVLEGGGIRGVAYVGALQALSDHQQLNQLERVGGTSAGAIAALAVALRYTPSEIEKIIYGTKLQKFNDGKFFFIGGLARLNRNYGWYRGKVFTRWLEELIYAKTKNKDITFQELHDQGFLDLYVTGTSLNHQKLIVFSRDTYPQMKVKDAVRISMSIPLYFQAVLIDASGVVKSRNEWRAEYDLMVDGGFTGNFPIAIFDSVTVSGGRIPNHNTIGLRIDTPEQIDYDKNDGGLAPVDITRFRNYVGAFYNFVIENLNRQNLTSADWQRTISISSGTIGPKIKKLSPQEKQELIRNGSTAVDVFLQSSRH